MLFRSSAFVDPGGLSEHVLSGVDRSRGGSLVAGHDLRYKARGSRAWGLSAGGGLRAVSPRGAGSGPARFWPSAPVDERTGLSEAFSHLFKGKELCRYID